MVALHHRETQSRGHERSSIAHGFLPFPFLMDRQQIGVSLSSMIIKYRAVMLMVDVRWVVPHTTLSKMTGSSMLRVCACYTTDT